MSLPAKFRAQLGEHPIMTRGLDGCLFIFAQTAWLNFAQQLQAATLTKHAHRDFARLMANEAAELEIDSQGRMLIPDAMRKKYFTKDVVFAGTVDHVELWDRQTYADYADNLEKHAVDIAEAFSETQEPKTNSQLPMSGAHAQ